MIYGDLVSSGEGCAEFWIEEYLMLHLRSTV